MYLMFANTRKAIGVLTLAVAGFATPVFAGETADCFWEVQERCDEALDASSWWEKPAVGLLCAGMMAGCAFESL